MEIRPTIAGMTFGCSKWLIGEGVSAKLRAYNKSVYDTYLNPSYHPSPPVPDVLPDASMVSTLLIKLGLTLKKVC